MTDTKQTIKAKIYWAPVQSGGREKPPVGPTYMAVARFETDESWPDMMWSLGVKFEEIASDLSYVIAQIGFLVPEAPSHLLRPGAKFELYEGAKRVAFGECIVQ